jgi:hypothetical protein
MAALLSGTYDTPLGPIAFSPEGEVLQDRFYGAMPGWGLPAGLPFPLALLLAAAGLNPAEKDQLSVLIIEHHIPLLMRLCDRLAVFDFGVRIALGTPEAIRRDPKWHRSHRAPGRARDPAGLQRRR